MLESKDINRSENLRSERAKSIIKIIGVNKKVNLNLVGLDGNAFNLMGVFSNKARREGWDSEEIEYVLDRCTEGDYNHLLCVLMEYCNMDSESVSIDRCEDDMPDVVYVNGVAYRR